MLGKPTVKGTRITVELVLQKLADGMDIAELCVAYPRLSESDVRAVLAFAADYIANEDVVFAEPAAA